MNFRLSRRSSFLNFLLFIGFVWFLLMVFYQSWTEDESQRGGKEIGVMKVLRNKLEAGEIEPVFDDFEDNFAGPPDPTRRPGKRRTVPKKVPEKVDEKIGNQENEKVATIEIEKVEPPEVSPEILELHSRLNLTNPGHLGKPVILPPNLPFDIQEKINKSWEIYSINEFVSNLIPLYRELPDVRPEYCKTVQYANNLPVTSVIMVFHNEPFSLIMRSVFAILNRTPPELLKEIVLVDDCSFYEELKNPLKEFIKGYLKIKLVRSPTRVGLIKARMIGCVNAEGEALVFMDAHIEVTEGWLEPLLDPIARNHNASTIPVVDGLDANTLEYKYGADPEHYMVGGFDWNLIYKWKDIPEWEKKRLKNPCDPIRTPTMLGAFFVIRKDYFELLGMFDPDFEIWGAENLEISFKVWMCFGELYQIPCSHAAHMFRKKHPYTYPKGGAEVRTNTDRLAEVWLDEYLRFYHRATKFDNRNFGDVSEQKKLRKDLGCRSFKWFIENVYQDVKYPDDIKDPPPANERVEINLTKLVTQTLNANLTQTIIKAGNNI